MNAQVEEIYDEDVIDFRAIFAILLHRRWWITGAVLVSVVAFTVAAFKMTPVYRASVLLIPAGAESSLSGSLTSALGQLGGLASLAGVDVGGGDSLTEEAMAVLVSRQFTGDFIAQKQLMPVLFAKHWDKTTGDWKVPEARQPTPSKAFLYFNRKIRVVSRDKKSGLVTMNIDWTDRNAAADWANELVERLNAEMRSRAITKADASLGYLQKELASTSVVEIREAINRLIEAQIKQRMLANVTQEYAFRVVDKAVVPDADSPVKPNKLLLLALGPLVGLFVGVVLALMNGAVDAKRK